MRVVAVAVGPAAGGTWGSGQSSSFFEGESAGSSSLHTAAFAPCLFAARLRSFSMACAFHLAIWSAGSDGRGCTSRQRATPLLGRGAAWLWSSEPGGGVAGGRPRAARSSSLAMRSRAGYKVLVEKPFGRSMIAGAPGGPCAGRVTRCYALLPRFLLMDWGVEWAGTVLYCTVLHGAVPCCAVQYGMVGGAGVHV